MFKCAWCKKENIDPHRWSKSKELICEDCTYKYDFALRNKLLKENVSDLSKEDRRKISRNLIKIDHIISAFRIIRAEKIKGKFYIINNLVICFFVISLLVLYQVIEFRNTFFGGLTEIIFYLVYITFSVLFCERIFRLLQYLQIKKKIKDDEFIN